MKALLNGSDRATGRAWSIYFIENDNADPFTDIDGSKCVVYDRVVTFYHFFKPFPRFHKHQSNTNYLQVLTHWLWLDPKLALELEN